MLIFLHDILELFPQFVCLARGRLVAAKMKGCIGKVVIFACMMYDDAPDVLGCCCCYRC